MTSVVALRHVAFETLGTLEGLFAKRGWNVSYVDVPTANLASFDSLKPDLLIVLGGPITATDDLNYPFLAQEVDILKKRLAADKPTLGICLGAQLIARAHEEGLTPDEVAAALRYLIDAPSVTGQMIAVDGGQHLGWQTPDIVAP